MPGYNEREIIDQICKEHANSEYNRMKLEIHGHSCDQETESPIEDVFLAALVAVRYGHRDLAFSCEEDPSGRPFYSGINIDSQFRLGKYRADFAVSFENKARSISKKVIVECAGTAFHERTEKERREEKARDRFFQKKGFPVFRYTGKELLDDPLLCAREVASFLSGIKEDRLLGGENCG